MMTQLVTTKQKADTMRGLIEQYKPSMAMVLPKHLTPDRMARVALHAMIKTPKLLDCSKESVIGAILECATLGLEPNVGGQCWILPYGNTATFIAGYRGLVQLARRSGELSTIFARAVYKKDDFDYCDYPPMLHHRRYRGPERGKLVAAYAVAKFKDGSEQWEVMEAHEIESVKRRSPAAKSQASPWNSLDDEPEMWKKTVLKKLCKMLPMSVEFMRATDLDEAAELGLKQDLSVPPTPEGLDPQKEIMPDSDTPTPNMDTFAAESAAQLSVYKKQLDVVKKPSQLVIWKQGNRGYRDKLLPEHAALIEQAIFDLEERFAE